MILRNVLAGALLAGGLAAQHSPASKSNESAAPRSEPWQHRAAVLLRLADGTPWANARVHAQAGFFHPGWVLPGSPRTEGVSDANGRCVLSLAPSTDHWIWAESAASDGKRWLADVVTARAEKVVRLVARPVAATPTVMRLRGMEGRCAKVRVRDRRLGWERVYEAPSSELTIEATPSPWLEVVLFDAMGRPSLLCDVPNDGGEHTIEPEPEHEQEIVIAGRPDGLDLTALRLQLWHRGEVFDLASLDGEGRARFDFNRWQALVDGRGQCAVGWGSEYLVNGDAIEPAAIDLVWAEYRRPDPSLPIPIELRARERTGGWFRFLLGGEELAQASLRQTIRLHFGLAGSSRPLDTARDERLAGRRVPVSMNLKDFPLWLTGAAAGESLLTREWQPWLEGVVPLLFDVPEDSPSPPHIDLDLATEFVRCEVTVVGADRSPAADQVLRWWVRPGDHQWRMEVRTDAKGVARFLLPKQLNGDAWCRHVSPQGWVSFLVRESAIAEAAKRGDVLRAEIRLLPVHRVRLVPSEPMEVGLAVMFEDLRLDPIPVAAISGQPDVIDVPNPTSTLAGFREIYEFRTYRLPDDLIAIPALPLRSVIHLRSRNAADKALAGFPRPSNFAIEASVEPQVLEFVVERR